MKVESFTLIDASTGLPIPRYDPIPAGAKIDLAKIKQPLNIRVNTSGTVHSLAIFVNGAQPIIENRPPYSVFGDKMVDGKTVYTSWRPEAGTYRISATPYPQSGASGTPGATTSVEFSVVAPPPPPRPYWLEPFKSLTSPRRGQLLLGTGFGYIITGVAGDECEVLLPALGSDAAGMAAVMTVAIVQGPQPGFAPAFPRVLWANGAVPEWSQEVGQIDVVTCLKLPGVERWLCSSVVGFSPADVTT